MNTASIARSFGNNAQHLPRDRYGLLRVMASIHDEASMELGAAVAGVSVRKIAAADIPGTSAYGLSRAINGADSNALYRLASLYMLLKKLGFKRERAQRVVDWQQTIVDWLWGPAEAETEKKEGSSGVGRADESR